MRRLAHVRGESVERIQPLAAHHARADLDVLVPHSAPVHGTTPEPQQAVAVETRLESD